MVKQYDIDIDRNLNRLSRNLRQKKWKFAPSEGILIRRENGKKPRPIVLSPIENRIIQRTILDILQEYPDLKQYLQNEYSFGGIKDRGVSDALASVQGIIHDGAKYFIRTDIKEFFRNIPRKLVVSKIADIVCEPAFIEMFKEATDTELSNMEKLASNADLFPIYDVGVAQGCCLSPFMGNILLEDFDRKMNDRGIRCIRYIDDFILLGPNKKHVFKAFDSARKVLQQLGLEVYNPMTNADKAEAGEVVEGFDFLGCTNLPGSIYPNKKSKQRLITQLNEIVKNSVLSMRTASNSEQYAIKKVSFIETLTNMSNILKGWGNGYFFCNHRQVFAELDKKIDEILQGYVRFFEEFEKKITSKERNMIYRRILGVHLLEDSKKPITEETGAFIN